MHLLTAGHKIYSKRLKNICIKYHFKQDSNHRPSMFKRKVSCTLPTSQPLRCLCLGLIVAMPIQYELRRLFHLMNIQTHRNSTPKALILGAYHPRIPRGDSARYINPWDNKLNFLRCTAEWILSFHWLHHHFLMSKMTNENDWRMKTISYKRAVIWLDRSL